MSNTNDQQIAVLNGLIETTLDSGYGYREAAGDARNPASRMINTDEQRAFTQEVAQRFGLVPNFFLSARDAPEVTGKLWEFAKSAYFDTPIPSLFKEGCSSTFPVLRGALLHHPALRLPAGVRPCRR